MVQTVASNFRARFGDQVKENVVLAPYTSARIGGPADFLITVRSSDELIDAVQLCQGTNLPMRLIGGGSNILVSDKGVRGVVILNKAKASEFHKSNAPTAWAESGVVLSNFAHRTAAEGLSGLEWAATIPGTVGGAVYGNAGAYGSDIAQNLVRAEILTETGREWWPVNNMNYGYRRSIFKDNGINCVILSAEFRLNNGDPETMKTAIEQYSIRRKATQPPGASMGSMFKNPPGDYAGRLIEAAGLKGMRIGNAEISNVHGNFFINHGATRAEDIKSLIFQAKEKVKKLFNIELELEVELIGEWE